MRDDTVPPHPQAVMSAAPTPSRRLFLTRGGLVLSGAALSGFPNLSVGERVVSLSESAVRFGVITDIHYADKTSSGSRYYRESMWKMQDAIQRFNVSDLDFIVELGDFIDSASGMQGEIHHLHAIDAEYAKFNGERHYVIGNHCVSTFTKPQFIENCGASEPYYSFDVGGFHFVVLDACFRYDEVPYGNGNFTWTQCEIPSFERDWLREDLATTNNPTVCFVHQRIDTPPDHGIKSYMLLREMLEEPQKVMAVFQGHSHTNYMRDSRRRQTNGFRDIYYLTLQAMVNGTGAAHNAYSIVSVYPDASILIEGYSDHVDRSLEARIVASVPDASAYR